MLHFLYNRENKERGVVLLTCLAFLLVLLSMLRFTITSSRMEERKASIDLDLTLARESARSAFNYVEYYLLRQGEAYCLSQNVDDDCKKAAPKYLSQLMQLSEDEIKNLDLKTDDLPSLKDLWGNGFYTGNYINEHYAHCQPLWICVDWGNEARQAQDAAEDQRKSVKIKLNHPLSILHCNHCNTRSERVPRFMVERLLPSELDIDPVDKKELEELAIIRVTALGFGLGDSRDSHLSSIMMQSTYVLY